MSFWETHTIFGRGNHVWKGKLSQNFESINILMWLCSWMFFSHCACLDSWFHCCCGIVSCHHSRFSSNMFFCLVRASDSLVLTSVPVLSCYRVLVSGVFMSWPLFLPLLSFWFVCAAGAPWHCSVDVARGRNTIGDWRRVAVGSFAFSFLGVSS